MLLKLLDRSDIIRYGKTILEVPNHIALNLVKAKRAIEFVGNLQREEKAKLSPSRDKMVWVSPEKKSLENMAIISQFPFPGKNDSLFPEHIIGRK